MLDDGYADLAIVDASIRTLDPQRPFATALAVRQGAVIAVGEYDEVAPKIGPRTAIQDRAGMAVVPGLVDCHTHQIWGAELSAGVDLAGMTHIGDVVDVLRRACDGLASDAWVRAWNLNYDVFGDNPVVHTAVTQAVGGRPALLMFYDLHTALVTPRALKLAGLTSDATFADRSEVVHGDGVPTGELREPSAYKRVLAVADALNPDDLAQRVLVTARRLAAIGLTGGHVMDGSLATYELLASIEAAAALPQRLNVAIWIEPHITDDDLDVLLELKNAAGRRWQGGIAKLFVDGVVETGTAWLHNPDCCGKGTKPFWHDLGRMRDVINTLASNGFQCAAHAIGDSAVTEVIDIYESLDLNTAQAPHRLEHLELLQDNDIDRLVRGGFVASMQPSYQEWTQNDTDAWAAHVSDRAQELGFRARDIADAGGLIALGSDWPVSGVDPRVGMAWARLGRRPGDAEAEGRFPHQTLTALQALEGYTVNAAAAVGDRRRGRIAPGFLADLSAFAADPVDVDADELEELPIELTIVDGEVVYDRATAV